MVTAPGTFSVNDPRFWSKVQPAGALECWLWTGAINPGGYARFWLDGGPKQAHRVAYEMLRAEIPNGLHLDHLCRVRRCVNPWHLEPVTNAVNSRRGDAWRHFGERTHCNYGHAFDKSNTRLAVTSSGTKKRVCRACAASNARRYTVNRRLAATA